VTGDALLEQLAELVAEKVAEKLEGRTRAKRWYTRESPPPRRSWRAAREHAKRLGIPTRQDGRELVIDADAWDRAVGLAPSRTDEDEAATWGAVVPLRGSR
jgi:hypothetical protein